LGKFIAVFLEEGAFFYLFFCLCMEYEMKDINMSVVKTAKGGWSISKKKDYKLNETTMK
jgi:hypothetical protein